MDDLITALPCRIQCRFIAHIGNVRPTETRGLARKEIHIDAVVHFDGAQMHFKNGPALGQVRHVHVNLAVKAPCTHEGLVQNIRTVGRREDDDSAVGAEAVHLGEELVEGVFPFVV